MKKYLRSGVQLAVACFVLLFSAPFPVNAATSTQSVAFPMYEFPGLTTLWHDVHAAGSKVPWIIVNPASGPGTSVSPYYTTALDNKPASQRAIGYIHANYHTRDIADLLAEIDDWYTMYPQISGIFMDLLKNGGAPADVCYAATIHNYVKSKHPNDLMVMNSGINVEAAYEPYGDIFGNAEGTLTTYSTWAPYTDGFENNPAYADRFWHIIHTSDAADLDEALTLTRANNAGWVLVTDLLMPNPYTDVPTYWTDFLDEVATLPQTAIPNRGLTALPAGCLDLSLQTSKASSAEVKQVTSTITNTVTNLDATRFSPGVTSLSYSLPSGATLTDLSGTGWDCSVAAKQCTSDASIAADTALPVVTATVKTGCNFTSGSVSITLRNFAGNSTTATSMLSKPADCITPPTTTDNSSKPTPTPRATSSQAIEQNNQDVVIVEEELVTTAEEPSDEPTTSAPLPTEEPQQSPSPTPDTDAKPKPESQSPSLPMPVVLGAGVVIVVGGVGTWLFVRTRKA